MIKSLLLILLSAVTYTNPIIYADYSDPDAIRVGNDYYMTSSSFNCFPGLQILHSTDLVNWQIINSALPQSYTPENGVEHGNLVWAPSIRYYNNRYYIFWGDPDRGIYYIQTDNVRHTWSAPTLLIAGKGYIDPCPYWQNDTLYIVHALAGSRAGLKSVLLMATMVDDCIVDHRIIFDGHADNPTCEGPKIYRRNSYYYIFTPAGGVATGWQLILRSKNIYGPYEQHIALRQGNTSINGPHQGAWVTASDGKDWFLHFQDVGALGRIVHLQPMTWQDDWPIIGNNGEPVDSCIAPYGCQRQIKPKHTTFQFDSTALDYSWQWHHTPQAQWYYCDAPQSMLRLYSVPSDNNATNLWSQPNLLLRKIDSPTQTIVTKVRLNAHNKINGERCGFIIMGLDYAGIAIEKQNDTIAAYAFECKKANKGNAEQHTSEPITLEPSQWIYIMTHISDNKAQFSISTDGQNYKLIGNHFTLKEGQWIGAKYGFFCTRPSLSNLRTRNDGGNMEIDYISINY